MSKRVLFHAGRALGQKGTQGTYLLVEAFSQKCDTLFLTLKPNQHSVRSDFGFKSLFLNGVDLNYYRDELLRFAPSVIWIFNYPGWWQAAEFYSTLFPRVPIVYDVQTPLLKRGQERKEINKSSQEVQKLLSGIFTLNRHSAESWFNELEVPVVEYSLGIDYHSIVRSSEKTPLRESSLNFKKKYVYIGSLDGVRNVVEMVRGFAEFLLLSKRNDVLDIFGDGSQAKEIQRLVASYNLEKNIVFHGLVSAERIYNELPSYDVGIAWVPNEVFSDSPSLKLLEYMAAGISVVATNTNAHKIVKAEGFSFTLCKDEAASLARTLLEFSGIPLESRVGNQKMAQKYSYDHIIEDEILPKLPERKTRIFILINTLADGKGGAEKIAVLLANEMSARGYDVYLLFKSGNPAYSPSKTVTQLTYERLAQVRQYLQRYDPDVYFCFGFNRQLINFARQSFGLNIPFGFQECTNPERLISNNWRVNRKVVPKHVAVWEREVLASYATRIRVVMPSYIDSFPKYLRYKVRGFCNASFGVSGDEKFVEKDSANYILSVNGAKGNKNFITLLQAFSKLSRKYENWKIVDIGKSLEGNEPHKVEIKRYIESENLSSRVTFLGPVDNPDSYFKGADFHVIASLSEGCPTVVLEAMANGIPSVGFEDCPGTNELIVNDENGLLAKVKDRTMGLAKEMEALMTDQELRIRLGEKAFQDSKEFSKNAVYDRWEALFLEMISSADSAWDCCSDKSSAEWERKLHVKRMQRRVING